MYFGNVEGLLEFDGLNRRLIKLPNFSMVRSPGMDKNGTVYVGGVGELGYLAPNKEGEMDYFSLLPLRDETINLGDLHHNDTPHPFAGDGKGARGVFLCGCPLRVPPPTFTITEQLR